MRLWSIHPSLLDSAGLVAVWREGLLAQKVLQGRTKGYRNHPQLVRFRESNAPLDAIAAYLWAIHDEASRRSYAFDASKIARRRRRITIRVTRGQVNYELLHLKRKLARRDPVKRRELRRLKSIRPHPIFRIVSGGRASWERVTARS